MVQVLKKELNNKLRPNNNLIPKIVNKYEFCDDIWSHIKGYLLDPLVSNVCKCGSDRNLRVIPKLVRSKISCKVPFIKIDSDNKYSVGDVSSKTFHIDMRTKFCGDCYRLLNWDNGVRKLIKGKIINDRMMKCKSQNELYRKRLLRETENNADDIDWKIITPYIDDMLIPIWKQFLKDQRWEQEKEMEYLLEYIQDHNEFMDEQNQGHTNKIIIMKKVATDFINGVITDKQFTELNNKYLSYNEHNFRNEYIHHIKNNINSYIPNYL